MSTTNEDNAPENEPEVVFHDDPVINAGLAKIEAKASFYDLAHGVLTGKFDQPFHDWLKSPSGVDMGEVENLPETSEIVEWMHIDANLASLLQFKEVLNSLLTECNLAIFGKYAAKNVRGSVPADTDLGAERAMLVKILTGTVTMIEAGIIDGMTVPMILKLPTLVKWAKANGSPSPRRPDGTWVIPNAPSDKSNGDSTPVGNLRSHNTNVKFVVDKVIFECPTLGEACAKLFGAKKPAEVAARFDNWSQDYFAIGDEQPKKAVLHDGKKIWLTKA